MKLTSDAKLFDGIVGQDAAKSKLHFYLDCYMTNRMVPNTMFIAPKGNGKTTLARAFAKGLVQFDEAGKPVMIDDPKNPGKQKQKRKPFIEVNCSTLKSVKQFFNGLVVPYINEKDVTVLFDEASEIPKDITMALLTILNPNPENRTTFSLDEYVCDFDFRKQTFIFATSEPQGVFHALLDRLKRIDLQDYTPVQLATIVQRGSKGVDYRDNILIKVAEVLRGNARAAQTMATDIMLYLRNRTVFGARDWKDLCAVLGILPLGVTALELTILRYLSSTADGTSLTCLSAKTGMSREALQRDGELYLMKHGLIEIATTGRIITAKGLQYLKDLDKQIKA